MDLVVETDIGHDPDDLLAICYLVSAGVTIRAIIVEPGDPDQIAVAKMLCKLLNLDIPVGNGKHDRTKLSSGGIHYDLLNKYKFPHTAAPDGLGSEIFMDVLCQFPKSDILVIGPPTSLGRYLRDNPVPAMLNSVTFQGGFLSYDQHTPKIRLEKFEGKGLVPSFNPNGDRKATRQLQDTQCKRLQIVSKNICHTVTYNREVHERFVVRDRASQLFREAMDFYLAKHDEKKLHDPTAAVCHLKPELATWYRGRLNGTHEGWGTVYDPNGHFVLADIDYNGLWKEILEGTT